MRYEKTEKRAHDRYPCDLPVGIAAEEGGDADPGRAVNISMGGILVRTEAYLEMGQEVFLSVDLPGAEEGASILSIVRWVSRERGAGLHFKILRAADTLALSKLVRHLSTVSDPV